MSKWQNLTPRQWRWWFYGVNWLLLIAAAIAPIALYLEYLERMK